MRIISDTSSYTLSLSKQQLLESIRLSEGRTLVSECIGTTQPLLNDVSNAELCSAMSADILLLNMFDVNQPAINGLPKNDNPVALLKQYTGRVIGINLEPVENISDSDPLWKMSNGRLANAENAIKAKQLGVDILCITGNPGNHVSNEGICKAIREIRAALGDDIIIISGKMHASGMLEEAGANILSKTDIENFVSAGADIILMPAVGTVPGVDLEMVRNMVNYVHSLGKLTMTSIGTSQEGSSTDTIKQIALYNKMAGTDIHHIGDSGYVGMALPENIMAYSIAIRGVRHTYHKMAQSINR